MKNLDVDAENVLSGSFQKEASIHIITPTIRPDFIGNIINNFVVQEVSNKRLTIAYNSSCDENERLSMTSEVEKVLDQGFHVEILFLPPSATPGEVLNTAINKHVDYDWHFRFDDDDLYGKNYIRNQIAIANFYDADFTGKRLSFIKKYNSKDICLRSDSESGSYPKLFIIE